MPRFGYAFPLVIDLAPIIAAFVQIGGALIAGYFLLRSHDEAARHRLTLDDRAALKRLGIEHRLKLLELAHAAVYGVTSAVTDGVEALAALNNLGRVESTSTRPG